MERIYQRLEIGDRIAYYSKSGAHGFYTVVDKPYNRAGYLYSVLVERDDGQQRLCMDYTRILSLYRTSVDVVIIRLKDIQADEIRFFTNYIGRVTTLDKELKKLGINRKDIVKLR